jgi:hypothetical protein
MSSRASHIVAALVLLVCLACPIIELFDHWDNTVQSGGDTEYIFVVLALCVGAEYVVARFDSALFVALAPAGFCCKGAGRDGGLALSLVQGLFIVPIPLSTPLLPLRI